MVPHLLEEAFPELERFARQASALLALDFDGTLSPIAPTPDGAEIEPSAARALGDLLAARLPRTWVAIASGRTVDSLRRLVRESHFWIGLHGLEVAEPGGPTRLRFDTRETDEALARLRRRLAETKLEGARLEDKGHAVALHVRGLPVEVGEASAARFLEAIEAERREGAPLEVLHGRAVIEARPAGARKDLALAELLERLGHPAFAFAGDDVTDEQVFASFPAGLTIAVMDHPRNTLARTYLRSPSEVARMIETVRRLRSR